MLGVFKKRWKPKNRVTKSENGDGLMLSCGNEYSEPINAYVLPDSRITKLCSTKQMFPMRDHDSRYSVTYETLLKPALMSPEKSPAVAGHVKPEIVPPPAGGNSVKTATVGSASGTAPNICIEGRRIEFVKSPTDCGGEKQDYLKEYLEAKIVQLESELVAERRVTQRERTVNSRLQKQLSRREWLQRDVDRERRLRLDTEARLKGSSSEADRCRAKLSALQKDFVKMEETVRTLLQYKSKFEQLKQDRHSVANSYENQILQLQNAITKLKIENETLKKQINTLEATGISQVQKALVERLRILEHEKSRIEREGEQQRKQYEKCLDDVAKQVVKAVLSQKGLREEISSLQHRVEELETGNCALSALLVQRLSNQRISYSPTTAVAMPVIESRSVMFDVHRSPPPPSMKMAAVERPASCDLTQGLTKPKNDGWRTSVSSPSSYHRPQSLNLEICRSLNADDEEDTTKCDRALGGDETPESSSGNRDEGYSTMSSDVQGTAEPPSAKGLEDVKEANENESNALTESSPCSRAMNSEDTDVIFVPLSLSFSFINPRHSYPPLRCLSTVPVQHIMRSYSDSHLFLKLTATTGCGGGGGGGVVEDEDRTSWYSGGELWDMDYVQHWLRLDETRTAIQQRMEYDAAELEDWTMDDGGGGGSGGCGPGTSCWKRMSATDGKQQSLPCIEEDDVGHDDVDDDDMSMLESNKDRDDVSWRQRMDQQPRPPPPPSSSYESGGSPGDGVGGGGVGGGGGDSWSSADEYAAAETPPSKRSSCCSDSVDLLLPPPGPIAGTDFTRDFYRLVKFESSKSLASTSSRSVTGGGGGGGCCWSSSIGPLPDREQALQTVLDFIAEQQQYCVSRQAEDKREPPAAASPVAAERPLPDSTGCDAADDVGGGRPDDESSAARVTPLGTVPEEGRRSDDCGQWWSSSSSSSSAAGCTSPQPASTSPQPPSTDAGGRSSGECTADTAVWTAAAASSSKDIIDQLNRMAAGGPAATAVSPHGATAAADLDEACCCPTGWVHVERDIDFADPKERANLLDVMLASSRSSSSSTTGTGSEDRGSCCSDSIGDGTEAAVNDATDDDDDDDGGGICNDETTDRPAAAATVERLTSSVGMDSVNSESYNRLHRLHRVRRQKKASAVRDGHLDVLRAPAAGHHRQSIVGRGDFFVRFGDKEREAMANFDFLDDLSATSPGSADSACDGPPPRTARDKCRPAYYTCSAPSPATVDCRRQRRRRRRYSGLSLSDSCGDSD